MRIDDVRLGWRELGWRHSVRLLRRGRHDCTEARPEADRGAMRVGSAQLGGCLADMRQPVGNLSCVV